MLGVCAAGMFGFGYALVPLYNIFCDITGLNGKTNSEAVEYIAETVAVDESRVVTVQFIANGNPGLPWEFGPKVHTVDVHPGETVTVNYFAHNLGGTAITGHAVPSVAPGAAAKHLNKVECFCFEQQTLAGGEARDMPVTFYVDPKLPERVSSLTLAYTFYEAEPVAAADGDSDAPADHSQHHHNLEQDSSSGT